MTMFPFPQSVDVLVVGGGPTGLLITHILLQYGLQVLAVEQYNKFEQAMFGRACVLYAGSMELLDLVGVYDRIADIGFIVRNAITYKDGEPSENRGWSFIDKATIGKTLFDFSLTIRQKHMEEAIRSAISQFNPDAVQAPVKLVGYRDDQSSEYPVVATLEYEGQPIEVKCKYLVGADGGRSTVRSLAHIPFPGTSSAFKWVRLDAIVKTDMPSSRSKAVALESREHGNVLWTPVDNGRTRIGFVCPDNVYGDGGSGISEEAIMAAAKNAVQPFTLEFVKLDWWTVYEIGQRVADRYQQGHIILAGDAAHTHSSGTAQGMNTGIHDAINLGWKLGGVLSSLYEETILETYEEERRASAQRLIQLDRDISSLISGKIPERFNAPAGANPNEYLEEVYSSNASFTVGLGISYETNILNQIATAEKTTVMNVGIGHRAPDAPVYRPGVAFPKSLRSLVSFNGRFWILVFTGKMVPSPDNQAVELNAGCALKYHALRDYIDSPNSFIQKLGPAFEFLTILLGDGSLQPAETLGALPLGKVVYDRSGEAFLKYGVDEGQGAIVVLRPDAIIGLFTRLDGYDELARYFTSIVRSRSQDGVGRRVATLTTGGEISIEGQEESTRIFTVG